MLKNNIICHTVHVCLEFTSHTGRKDCRKSLKFHIKDLDMEIKLNLQIKFQYEHVTLMS